MDQTRANRLLGNIALALLVFTVAAFGVKAIAQPEVQARYTPLVIFHAVCMLAWIGLLSGQAHLAAAKRFAAHKAFGRASIALVGAMAASGMMVAVNIGAELGRYEVTVVNIAAFVTFIPLYFAAITFARKRQIHAHRQAMLIGTLAFMTPVYARVTDVLGLPPQLAIVVQFPITIAIALGYDWATQRRVTKPALGMLAFSFAVLVVMAAVLVVWFL